MKSGYAWAACSAALVTVMVLVFAFGGCSSNSSLSQAPAIQRPQLEPAMPNAGQTTILRLSPSGGTYTLPLPEGYSGSMTVGPNRAPLGASLRVGSVIAGAAGGRELLSTTHRDPFPILFTFFNFLPFPITLPIDSFSVCLPAWVRPGTIDISLLNDSTAVSASNPLALTQATITPPVPHPHDCRGATLNVPSFTITLEPQTLFTLELFRDVSANYPGGASTAVLPVQPGMTQPLPSVGTLGATVNYDLAAGSGTNGFLVWQNISGAPTGVAPFIRNDGPIQSLVVTATQGVTLDRVKVTSATSASEASAAILRTLTTTSSSAPGTFVPDGNIVLGPFPATIAGNQLSFNASGLSGLKLNSTTAWGFFVVTVTVCVPRSTTLPCDGSEVGNPNNPNPSQSNALTTVAPPGNRFPFQRDVFVSDASNRLTGSYTLSVAGATSTDSAPCSIPSNAPDNNGDIPLSPPWPHYSDAANNSGANNGPNAEFEVNFNSTGTCTIIASYNGSQVASAAISVVSSSLGTFAHPFTLRPPVQGPRGYAVTGKIGP